MSRTAVANRAGLSRTTVARLERGSPAATLAAIVAATSAVGLDLVCQLYPASGPRLRDTGQMRVAQRLAARASPAWKMSLEELAGQHGEAIDQVFWGAAEIVAVEIERRLTDFQAQFRRASLKRDWLADQHRRPVRLVIAVEDTPRNREVIAPHAALVRAALPLGSRTILTALRSGQPLGADGMCWIRPWRA